MNFRNNLYFIDAENRTDSGVSYSLRLNADHVIYKAHFPGEPITPGVCILQMGFELLSEAVAERLEISCVKNVKFLSILRPDCAPLTAEVQKIVADGDTVKAQISFSSADTAIAKISLVCRRIAE